MANIQVAQAALKEPPKLTDAEVAYNQQVAEFVAAIKLIASDVKDDMKERQFTSGLKGEKSTVKELLTEARSTDWPASSTSQPRRPRSSKGRNQEGRRRIHWICHPRLHQARDGQRDWSERGTILWPRPEAHLLCSNITRFFTHRAVPMV